MKPSSLYQGPKSCCQHLQCYHVTDEAVHMCVCVCVCVWRGIPLCSTRWPRRQRICLPCKLNVHRLHNVGCRGYRFIECQHEADPEDRAPLGHMRRIWSMSIGRRWSWSSCVTLTCPSGTKRHIFWLLDVKAGGVVVCHIALDMHALPASQV